MRHVWFFLTDFIKSSKGVDQQHTKVITYKLFMSVERMSVKRVNDNTMPDAELQ